MYQVLTRNRFLSKSLSKDMSTGGATSWGISNLGEWKLKENRGIQRIAAAENQALKGLRGFLEEGLSDGRVVVATRESALSLME